MFSVLLALYFTVLTVVVAVYFTVQPTPFSTIVETVKGWFA
jgi:hypothetical protein